MGRGPAGQTRIVQRRAITVVFPVTLVLGVQYGLLVVLPAVLHHTDPLSSILRICVVGIASAFAIEALRVPLGPRNRPEMPISVRSAQWILGIGWVASIAQSWIAGSAYANQIASAAPSHWVSFFTPFTYWVTIGTALNLAFGARGEISHRRMRVTVLASLGLEVGLGFRNAIFGQAVAFVFAVGFIALALRLVRWRSVIVTLMAAVLLWPAVYALRNSERAADLHQPGVPIADSGQRLRMDLEMAQVRVFAVGASPSIDSPSLGAMLRTGLVPRVFDPGRHTANTATSLSVALGGQTTTADTATTLGDAFIVGGWWAVIFYPAAVALVVGMLVRRKGPWAVAILAIVAQYGLWIEVTYPDLLEAVLQAFISLVAAWVLLCRQRPAAHLSPVDPMSSQSLAVGNRDIGTEGPRSEVNAGI